MNAKNKTFIYLLVVVMLVLHALPVAAQGETPPLPADVIVSDEPSNIDVDWPITKKETHRKKDKKSGNNIVETIEIRQQPQGKSNKDCDNNSANKIDAVAAATCQFSISIQQTSTVYVWGGAVTSVVKAFADKYCNTANGVCDYVKMKTVQVYWTRTATNFGVINAKSYMGCVGGLCLVCANGVVTTTYYFSSTTFNPSWNGLKTLTYTSVAPANMPIMMAFVEQGGYPIAGNNSTATVPRTAYSISNYVTFFFP